MSTLTLVRLAALLSVLLPVDVTAAQARRSPLENGEVLDVSIRAPAGTRAHFYRLDAADGTSAQPLGVVRWLVGPDALWRGATRAETQVTWFAEKTRVHHQECWAGEQSKLVWREVRARGGRTVLLASAESGQLASSEPVGADVLRRTFPADTSSPLRLIESLRDGKPQPACLSVFSPLAHRVEVLSIDTVTPTDGTGARIVELRRSDRGLAGRYRFLGTELIGFRLQERGPSARTISKSEYDALLLSQGY